MTISKETIETRKEELKTEYKTLKDRISMGEKEIETMKKNLDALAGAVQQCDLFLKEFEDLNDFYTIHKIFLFLSFSSPSSLAAGSGVPIRMWKIEFGR